jgi:hypothetical protein
MKSIASILFGAGASVALAWGLAAADLPNSIPIPAPAEAAFLAAIAVAQQQKARSFELRAAAFPRQALPVHGPPDRRPRRSGSSAGWIFADAGVSGDC